MPLSKITMDEAGNAFPLKGDFRRMSPKEMNDHRAKFIGRKNHVPKMDHPDQIDIVDQAIERNALPSATNRRRKPITLDNTKGKQEFVKPDPTNTGELITDPEHHRKQKGKQDVAISDTANSTASSITDPVISAPPRNPTDKGVSSRNDAENGDFADTKKNKDLTIADKVENARRMLSECRTDFERIQVRDHAKAAQEAARILGIRDIQIHASILVQDAEREIHKANPSRQGRRPDKKQEDGTSLSGITKLSNEVIRQIRHTHREIDDDAYGEIKRQAIELGEPLSRALVRKLARGEPVPVEKKSESERIRYRIMSIIETMRQSKNSKKYRRAIEFLEKSYDAM